MAIAEVLKTSGTSVHVGSSPTPSVELETSDGSLETKFEGSVYIPSIVPASTKNIHSC